jgi:hypothetical protein
MFCIGLSVLMLQLAKHSAGIILAGELTVMGVIFALLAEIVLTRRLTFPRVLELTDNAILFPHGFPWTRVTAIPCTDIIRVIDCGDSLATVTDMGRFAIMASHFRGVEHYCAVREFISAKMSILLPGHAKEQSSRLTGLPPRFVVHWVELPPPLVHWVEPEDWNHYRTHVVRSKPALARLGKEAWFFARCLGFILFPWLLLRLSQLPTSSAFPALSVLATLLLAVLHWQNATYPVRSGTEISFRDNGITELLCNGQGGDWNYHHLYGWALIEREFKERILHILLLKGRGWVHAFALPDAGVRSRLVEILTDKHVPQASDIKPSWEAET